METSHPDTPDQNPGGTNTMPTPGSEGNPSADNQNPSDSTQDQPQAPSQGTPSGDGDNTADDEQLRSYAKSVGVSEDKLSDPDVIRLLKLSRNDRAEKDRNYQAAKNAEDKIRNFGEDQFTDPQPNSQNRKDGDDFYPDGNYPDPVDEFRRELDQVKWKSTVANFFALNEDAKKYIDEMDKIAKERPYMYKDLPVLLELAKARSGSVDTAKEAGRQEERTRLAQMSQASAPSSSAIDSAPQGAKVYTRDEIRNMSRSEYEKHREDIVRAEREGRVK